MQVNSLIEYFEENDADEVALRNIKVRNFDQRKRKKAEAQVVIHTGQDDIQINREMDLDAVESGFTFQYKPALYESSWLFGALSGFYTDQWFEDILRKVKGGKEASVYLCRSHPSVVTPYLAAKVYRPRQFRNLRKDHIYREGRDVLDGEGHVITDDGRLHAIRKKTEFGKELSHSSWIDYEVQTLKKLNSVGADVPRVYANGQMAILMDFIGDGDGGAPALVEVDLERKEAQHLFEQTYHNIELMLANQIIHGDLSAYNILYWEGNIMLIDFPQVVRPQQNPAAYPIFQRDVARVCDYFSAQGVPALAPAKLARDLWQKYQPGFEHWFDPGWLDPDDPEDRLFWEKQFTK